MADTDLYVLARSALLDALDALGANRDAVIICGAQAIYLHAGEADLAVSPYTTDADLVLAPGRLTDDSPLEELLQRAGFRAAAHPGIWESRDGVEVDILVPEALGGRGRRGARLGPPHGNRVARKVRGLEGALIDHSKMAIGALDPADLREFNVAVAGPAALLISKLHKIAERAELRTSRLNDKDALDVLRLLRALPTERLARTIETLAKNEVSKQTTADAVGMLRALFAADTAMGTEMAVRATEGLADASEVSQSCVALASDLLSAIGA